jgi:hypothetical protein
VWLYYGYLSGVVMLWVFKGCGYAVGIYGVWLFYEYLRAVVLLWVFKGCDYVMGI